MHEEPEHNFLPREGDDQAMMDQVQLALIALALVLSARLSCRGLLRAGSVGA